ncbi:DUF371 domain-containing protein [Candidatus Woesearchaeota archaeon]|nr:DUF371 domain-containing protein [Candidatus Woesearchaeota archaeon]
MKYTFPAKGHKNILAKHKSTLEITKDSELTEKGDCIVAVAADFSLDEIKKVIGSCQEGKIRLTITAAGITEVVVANVNKDFSSNHEIVFRTGGFVSERTLGTRADKAAMHLDRKLVEKIKGGTGILVTIEPT